MARKILALSLAFLAALAVAAAAWFLIEFSTPNRAFQNSVVFTVRKGETATGVAHGLKQRKVIRRTWPFLLGYRLFFASETLKAGEYSLQPPLSPRDVLALITSGKVNLYPVTIPEGLTRREIAAHFEGALFIDSAEFLELTEDAALIEDIDPEAGSLEGYLFPETYHFPNGTTTRTIIRTMVSQFRRVLSPEWKSRARETGFSVRQAVTLASMIEKETSIAEEKALVSAVFHNRLRLGMKLDCDPTIIYALKEEGRFDGNLRRPDLALDSPYNTYLHAGLPPGPIANPGRDSLRAALYPAGGDYLYFVSKNDGSHHFSSSLREHQNAVNLYQRSGRRHRP